MDRVRDLGEAARALEATLVKQLLESSQAFKGSTSAGSHLQTGMFVEALADAVSKGGGLGIARMIEESLGEKDALLPSADLEAALSEVELPPPMFADPVFDRENQAGVIGGKSADPQRALNSYRIGAEESLEGSPKQVSKLP